MDIYSQIAKQIIEHQESIIGPVAVEQAQQVQGLNLDWSHHEATVKGDGAATIDELVEQYKALFGQISVEVCKEAVAQLLSGLETEKRPKSLV